MRTSKDYLNDSFSEDVVEEEGVTVYDLTSNRTAKMFTDMSDNPVHEIVDWFYSPLTGYDNSLSGTFFGENLAYHCLDLAEENQEVKVRTWDWERKIEDPEWYEVAETVLEGISDLEGYRRSLMNSAEEFLENKRE